jgi:hypothetical protein
MPISQQEDGLIGNRLMKDLPYHLN